MRGLHLAAAIFRRVGSTIVMLAMVLIIIFVTLRIIPGDPLEAMLGGTESLTKEAQIEFRKEYGLDESIPIQFVDWLAKAARGDLSRSLRTGQPVAEALVESFEPTLVLGLLSFGLVIAIGVALGIVAGLTRRTWLDRVIQLLLNLGLAVPNITLAIGMILVFGVWQQWVPVLGYVSPSEDPLGSLQSLILPAIALSSHFVGEAGRQTRAAVREASTQPHIRTGHAKGLKPGLLIFRYILRTASPPIVAILGLQFGRLFAGTVIIESMFLIPGLGRLLVEAILFRDFPVIQGGVLLIAMLVVTGNFLADLLATALDPRQRHA